MPVLSAVIEPITVRDILTRSLRKLGAIASGEVPEAAEIEDARVELNAMLDEWNAEPLTVYTLNREVFPLSNGKQVYSVGPGGDWDTVRPPKLEYVLWQNTLVTPVAEYPVEKLDDKEWAGIAIKGLSAQRPLQVWYDPTFPLGTLSAWPIPSASSNLVIGTWQQFARFTDVNDQFAFPPGYENAIVHHLAIQIAPEYDKEASATVVQKAKLAKAALKRMNYTPALLRCDEGATGGGGGIYDIRSDSLIRPGSSIR